MTYLHELVPGQTAMIEQIDAHSEELHLFWPLGLFPGELLIYKRKAPYFGDPILVEIRGVQVAIGLNEAKKIRVNLK